MLREYHERLLLSEVSQFVQSFYACLKIITKSNFLHETRQLVVVLIYYYTVMSIGTCLTKNVTVYSLAIGSFKLLNSLC